MQLTKEERCKDIQDIHASTYCGKYRYMPIEKRKRFIAKWHNLNKASAKLASFTHNISRFPIGKAKFRIGELQEASQEEKYQAKKNYYIRRWQAIQGLPIGFLPNLTNSQEEELASLKRQAKAYLASWGQRGLPNFPPFILMQALATEEDRQSATSASAKK
jgi:hypothetical protein